ncbi:MAG: hypothetical protein GVY24_05630, partial [Planctomycetes bacterium]|nr:hypothetical protein [Planctomycetota bacterium]
MPPPLDPARRTWHITFGTYATRLHNDPRPTVDRRHNQLGSAFPPPDPSRQQRPAHDALYLTVEQRRHIEAVIPDLCTRGGWTFRACAAPRDADHVHALLDADPAAPPKAIRQWLKRWLGESLTQTFGPPP